MSQGRLASNSNPPQPRDPLARLFAGSSLAGRTDGELLARFVADRDELAFEGLVVRLGPMVLGVCRRMLGDRSEVDDAFQATFLVLIRRAGAVGRGDLIGPWLHGVAVRVCRQARARQARRQVREQTGAAVEEWVDQAEDSAESRMNQAETRASIDDAIARLPEGYRRLVVLCDVEGLSRDEAADRLGWTANMVRGRLARARSQLRARLIHRGCVPPGLTVETGSGLGLGVWVGPVAPSPVLVATTARVALLFDSPTGRRLAATLAATSAPQLASGVLHAMFYSSWKVVGTSLLLGGSLVGGAAGVLLARGPAAPVGSNSPPPQTASGLKNLATAQQLEGQFLAAQYRYAAAKTKYDSKDGTVYGVLAASQDLMETDLMLHTAPEGREVALQAYLDRTNQLLANQTKRLALGYTTQDNVAAVKRASGDALALLERSRIPEAVIAAPVSLDVIPESILRQLEIRCALAREDFERQFQAHNKEQTPISDVLAASRRLMRAELASALTPYQRRAAVQAHLEQVERIFKDKQERVLDGKVDKADEAEALQALTAAQILLAEQPDGLAAPVVQLPLQPARLDGDSNPLGDVIRQYEATKAAYDNGKTSSLVFRAIASISLLLARR